MIFGITSEEETFLAHIEIEAFQATISESNYWIFFADVAFGLRIGGVVSLQSYEAVKDSIDTYLMFGIFCSRETMEDRKPYQTLWFMLQPAEEMLRFY